MTDAAAVLPGGATASQLRSPDLPRRMVNGYEVAATNRLLERAAKTIDGLNSLVKQLRHQVEELTAARDEARRTLESELDGTGVHKAIGEVLVTAHKAAETLRSEAEREAEEIRRSAEDAHEQASEIVAEAERRAAEIVAAAEAEVFGRRAELEQSLSGLKHEIDSTRAMWSALLRETLALVERNAEEPAATEDEATHREERAADTQLSAELRDQLAVVAHDMHGDGGKHPE